MPFDVEHAWSGVLGVTRDWCTSVHFDQATGIGHTMGYAGHGVTSAYVAARSLAHLTLGLDIAVHPTAVGGPPIALVGARAAPLGGRALHVPPVPHRRLVGGTAGFRRNQWLGRAAGHLAGLHA